MDLQLQTALIAAGVGLLTAILGTFITWRLEQRRWLTGLKATLQVEVLKTRIQTYPAVFAIFGRLSSRAPNPIDRSSALQAANDLSAWIYSAGGMSAEASTRGAILALRELLLKWNKEGDRPKDFYRWRNRALLLLRRDIDVAGLESYDPEDVRTPWAQPVVAFDLAGSVGQDAPCAGC